MRRDLHLGGARNVANGIRCLPDGVLSQMAAITLLIHKTCLPERNGAERNGKLGNNWESAGKVRQALESSEPDRPKGLPLGAVSSSRQLPSSASPPCEMA